VNFYHVYSLFKRGESATRSENYDVAKEAYEAFLKQYKGDKASKNTNWANFYINYAISAFKTGDLKGGLKSFQKALDNQNKFLTPPTSIYKAFDAFTELAIENKDEKVVIEFLKKYRSKLLTDSFSLSQFARGLIGKASAAIAADMQVLPLELLSLVPNTSVSINDLNAQLEAFKGAKMTKPLRDGYIYISQDYIQKLLGTLKDQAKGKEPNESFTLNLTAYLWGRAGNHTAAYCAYKELEENYSNSANREDNLFSLVRSANTIGRAKEANEYGNTFIKSFPDSEKIDEIYRLMLSGLYFQQKYKECIEIASGMLPDLEAEAAAEENGTEAHDICLFVLGGSKFYTGEVAEAKTYIEQHISKYKNSKFTEQAEYMQGSIYSRLGQFDKAAGIIDAYLEKYKGSKSPYYPYALFDRANCAYSLDDNKGALDKISQLEKDYLRAVVIAPAFNLKGNILEVEEEYKRAEEYYQRAFERAEKLGDKVTASESLYYLVNLLSDFPGEGDRTAEAATFYDKYWEGYSTGSPYQAQVAVSGYEALKKISRGEEGLNKMEEVVAAVANMPGQPQLEALINTYRDAFLESNKIDQLKERFYDFPGITEENKEALALIKISLIGAFEDELDVSRNAKSEDKARKLEADIKVIFNDLKRDFKPDTLTPNALAKVGDYIRSKTGNPREAIAYYDEILKRQDAANSNRAKFGIADIYGTSPKADEKAKAKQYLVEISSAEHVKKSDQEKALFRLIELHVKNGEWADVNTVSKQYVDAKFQKNLGFSVYYQALALDKQGKEDAARKAYSNTYFGNQGLMLVAAPSLKRLMELYWKRNTPAKIVDGVEKTAADRQFAYDLGWKYINATERHLSKLTDEESKLRGQVQALVTEYEQSKQIIDMATQKKNKN